MSQVHGFILPVNGKRDSIVWPSTSAGIDAVRPYEITVALVPPGPSLWPLPDALVQRRPGVSLEAGCNGSKVIVLAWVRAVISHVT